MARGRHFAQGAPPGAPEGGPGARGGAEAGLVSLAAGGGRLVLAPGRGGSIAEWWLERDGRAVPLLRAWDRASPGPYALACFPLVPWSNRISGGGFESASGFVAVPPNRADSPLPIHGHVFQRAWSVAEVAPDRAALAVESAPEDLPWRYRAVERFLLEPGRLEVRLAVTHLGPEPMPYGLGLHPYFPRTPATRLAFAASGVWECGADLLPTRLVEPSPPALDFRGGRTLAGGAPVDHGYAGWDGVARIEWPEHGLALLLRARTPYLHVYLPPGEPFLCLEPVTHPVDAFHLEGRPGLALLEEGRTLELAVELEVAGAP